MSSPRPQVNVESFAAIVEQHTPRLHRVAMRLSGNAETAKDLVQETLARALERFHRFEPNTHAGTWLATILTNLFLDQIKHDKVVSKAEPELQIIDRAGESDPLVAGIADDELYAAVRALEPELREVVELCYLQQLQYREAAVRLRLPVGTIGTRLMRARARLRMLLNPASLDAVS